MSLIVDDQVIFIHNPRTSGTSLRRAMLHGKDPNLNIPYPGSLVSRATTNRKHMTASQVREKLAPEIWDSRFKFSVVRNPLDRMVSLYGLFRKPLLKDSKLWKVNKLAMQCSHAGVHIHMPKKEKKALHVAVLNLSFKDWIKWCDDYRWNGCAYIDSRRPMTRIQQVEWFDGLDKVFRFEDREEINDFLRNYGYGTPKIENKTTHKPWESYYDAEVYDLVSDIFKDDLREFGYG